jgi:hypothetical protein
MTLTATEDFFGEEKRAMKNLSVLPLLLAGVGVPLVMLALSAGCRTSCLAGLLGALRELADATQREAMLDEQRQRVRSQAGAREGILVDLRANRIGLLEAAQRFGELNRQLDEGTSYVFFRFRGGSEGERLCRQVIQWIKCREPDPPGLKDLAFRHGLEAEMEALLRRDGEVRLPKPSRGNESRAVPRGD